MRVTIGGHSWWFAVVHKTLRKFGPKVYLLRAHLIHGKITRVTKHLIG